MLEAIGLSKKYGERSVFITTHDIFDALNLVTRIGIMGKETLIHTLDAGDILAFYLQQLYL